VRTLLALLLVFPIVASAQDLGNPGQLGASLAGDLTLRVFSSRATRVEAWLYSDPTGSSTGSFAMTQDKTNVWSVTIPKASLPSGTIYYGYRAWGPNWTYASTWAPGKNDGFVADVDAQGNRFNPNKLLLDPYALEMSHDPVTPSQRDGKVYSTGAATRDTDTGPFAPKGIVLAAVVAPTSVVGTKPDRAFKDDVIYEVQVRGLTASDPSVPAALRGTFAGAALKAAALKELGVTAVEFLPLCETQNDTNDLAPAVTANYWGYATLDYFAPDRRFSSDKTPGGPTRELKAMVKAFHDQGLKVYVDMVFNHTGEGGVSKGDVTVASLYSFRGLDNPTYYELAADDQHYYDNTGVGANFNCANGTVRDLVLDSLKYWKNGLGVDGFRFDLAPVLGNSKAKGGFAFDKLDPTNALNRAVKELPVRPASGGSGVDLIAEPWAVGAGTYQLGGFPSGWAEWNGVFRDTLRTSEDELGVANMTPGMLAERVSGSADLFQDDGRKPWHSVNFITAHDGFTLKDLFSFDTKENGQAYPLGPSPGGVDANLSWDHGGNAEAQKQAARTALTLLLVSAGVPMIEGGDEMLRTQHGNNNAYNLDNAEFWLDHSLEQTNEHHFVFTRKLLAFRAAHPALRPADWRGKGDISWLTRHAAVRTSAQQGDGGDTFFAFQLDGKSAGDSVKSIYVAYNRDQVAVTATLPSGNWSRVLDTAAWMESEDNIRDPGSEDVIHGSSYTLQARSAIVLIEK
jgi:glycogen operon protein